MDLLLNPSVIGFIVFLALLLLNMPIFASLGLAALFTLVVFDAAPLAVVPYVLGGSLDKFPLLATPLFIIAGAMITRSGMSRRIVNLAQVVLGQLPGGLALATLLTGAIISSMSGSNIATVAALSFLIPAMAEVRYPKPFAVAVVAAGCTFGVVIPPSIGMIIYGVITEQSIPRLFFAGIGPGVLMFLTLGLCTFLISKKNDYRGIKVERTWASFLRAFKDAIWGLLAPVIILGGIYSGAFTATEAAAVAVVYIFVIDLFIYRRIGLSNYPAMLYDSGKTIGVVALIIACSSVFAWIWQTQGVANVITENLLDWSGGHPVIILLFINVLLVLCGAFPRADRGDVPARPAREADSGGGEHRSHSLRGDDDGQPLDGAPDASGRRRACSLRRRSAVSRSKRPRSGQSRSCSAKSSSFCSSRTSPRSPCSSPRPSR